MNLRSIDVRGNVFTSYSKCIGVLLLIILVISYQSAGELCLLFWSIFKRSVIYFFGWNLETFNLVDKVFDTFLFAFSHLIGLLLILVLTAYLLERIYRFRKKVKLGQDILYVVFTYLCVSLIALANLYYPFSNEYGITGGIAHPTESGYGIEASHRVVRHGIAEQILLGVMLLITVFMFLKHIYVTYIQSSKHAISVILTFGLAFLEIMALLLLLIPHSAVVFGESIGADTLQHLLSCNYIPMNTVLLYCVHILNDSVGDIVLYAALLIILLLRFRVMVKTTYPVVQFVCYASGYVMLINLIGFTLLHLSGVRTLGYIWSLHVSYDILYTVESLSAMSFLVSLLYLTVNFIAGRSAHREQVWGWSLRFLQRLS